MTIDQQQQHAILGVQEKETIYSDGATPLFLAIEETDWRRALDIAEEFPDQVRTWVRSTGTENTTFAWSMWRRLPIHEACRRQAPAWLVSSLFSAFPESAYRTTQFGELPLHLAVESGAAPEVVNLIMVANWSAIVTPDNSGRIPTDILDRGELLLLDDHRIVHESLLRCHKSYSDMQRSAGDEQAAIKRKYNGQITSVQRQHQESLQKEYKRHEELQSEITALKAKIDGMEKTDTAKDVLVEETKQESRSWKHKAESLSATIQLLEEALACEKNTVALLTKRIEGYRGEVSMRDGIIECLSNDLRAVYVMHDEDLMDSVRDAERTMRAMVNSQIALQKKLAGQANGIKELLLARGIGLGHSPKEVIQEEKEPHHDGDPVDSLEVANTLAAAAMAALVMK